MKEKDTTIKDKLIGYGVDILKQIIITLIKIKLTPKKNDTSEKIFKSKNKKKKKKIIRKIIFAVLVNELVLNRLQSKILLKPNSKDLSWLLDYPARNHLVKLDEYIQVLNKNCQVLDLGSGSGYFAIETANFLNSSGKVYCVDINNSALEKLKSNSEDEQIINIEFHRANIENLPFESNFFDTAFMNMTLGQIKDKFKALSEANRVLKKEGHLIITELLIDPYYCLRSNVLALAETANFKCISEKGNLLKYTLVLKKV